MKAATLYQPYASAVPLGWKRYETRSWSTTWRGLIAIHAALERHRKASDIRAQALDLLSQGGLPDWPAPPEFPRGAIVAVARLVNVVRVEHVGEISALERAFGDYTPGRFAWKLEDVRPVEPIEIKGMQGLWEVPAPIARHLRELAA